MLPVQRTKNPHSGGATVPALVPSRYFLTLFPAFYLFVGHSSLFSTHCITPARAVAGILLSYTPFIQGQIHQYANPSNMPMRNPFVRRPGVVIPSQQQDSAHLGFERVDTIGSKASILSLRSDKSNEPVQYEMSGKWLSSWPVCPFGQGIETLFGGLQVRCLIACSCSIPLGT